MKKIYTILIMYVFLSLITTDVKAQLVKGEAFLGLNLSQIDGDKAYGYKRLGLHAGFGGLVPVYQKGDFSIDFSLEVAFNQKGSHQGQLYNDTVNGDYSLNTEIVTTDNIAGGAERYEVKTDRTELPNVLIYRDENAIHASLMLASSFDRVLLGRADQKAPNRYAISLTEATQFRDKTEGRPIADFIIVFVSESNIEAAFGSGS